MPEQERRVGSDRDLRGGDRLRGVPHIRETARRDLEMQLHRGAGGLGRDGRRPADQALDTVDVELEVLPRAATIWSLSSV